MKQTIFAFFILSGVVAVIFGTMKVAASSDTLISYWNLDETSGTTFADSVGPNDATCTDLSCPVTAVGIAGNALLFDGTDDGLDVADDPSLDWAVDDSFSIVAWVKGTQCGDPNSTNPRSVVIGKRRGSGGGEWWLGCIANSGKYVAAFNLRDSNGQPILMSGVTTITDDQWHQLVATWDTTTMRLFVDGHEEAAQTVAFTGVFANDRKLTMGYYNVSPYYWFGGTIDEVKLYNAAMVPASITSTPVGVALLDQLYTYTLTTTGDPAPTITLSQAPDGMTIDLDTGIISWTPTTIGSFAVEIEASNELRTETQAFTIEVIEDFGLLVSKTVDDYLLNNGADATFTIGITNTSSVSLALAVADPLGPDCVTALPQNTIAASTSIFYDCTTNNVKADFTNVITVTGTYTPAAGSPLSMAVSDSAFVDVLPAIELSQSLAPASLPEPGGPVIVSLTITNLNEDPVDLTSLTTVPYGDVTNPSNAAITTTSCLKGSIAGSAAYTCSFTVNSATQSGQYNVVTTAVVQDSNANVTQKTATSTITVTNVPSTIAVAVSANPTSVVAPGGSVTFLVEITNTSPVRSVVINSLSSQLLGSLNGVGTCNLPTPSILPGGKYSCSFTATVSGTAGQVVSNQVSAAGSDNNGAPVSNNGVATVTITAVAADEYRVFLPFITSGN